jgi:hypothetical protein
MRSTSPPKSAWPGVSTILMRVFLPHDRGRLGEDRDAALALQVVRVHRAFGDALVLAERAGLLQQAVDQRGLAVVDVGDDRDVAQVHDENLNSQDENERIRLLPQTMPGSRHGLRIDQSLVAKVFGPEPTVSDVTRSKTF